MISTQQFPQMRFCDVCRLIDNDITPKLCNYCGLCDAWICQDDSNWMKPKVGARRLLAAAKRKLEPGSNAAENYAELAVPDEQQREKYLKEME